MGAFLDMLRVTCPSVALLVESPTTSSLSAHSTKQTLAFCLKKNAYCASHWTSLTVG